MKSNNLSVLETLTKDFPNLKFFHHPENGDDNSLEIMNTLMKPFFDNLGIELSDTQWAEFHDRYLACTKFLVHARKDWALEQQKKGN